MQIKKMRAGRLYVDPQQDTTMSSLGFTDTKTEKLGIGKVILAADVDEKGNAMDIKTGDTIIFSVGATAKVPVGAEIIYVLHERDAFAIL